MNSKEELILDEGESRLSLNSVTISEFSPLSMLFFVRVCACYHGSIRWRLAEHSNRAKRKKYLPKEPTEKRGQ